MYLISIIVYNIIVLCLRLQPRYDSIFKFILLKDETGMIWKMDRLDTFEEILFLIRSHPENLLIRFLILRRTTEIRFEFTWILVRLYKVVLNFNNVPDTKYESDLSADDKREVD